MDAAAWDERYRSKPLVWSGEPNQFLADRVEDLVPGHALDLAAGEGRNALWLAEQGWQVTAVDYSRVAIDKARRLAAERGSMIEWVAADLLAWEPPTTYDLVIELYLHLPPDEIEVIHRKAVDALAPGGRLVIVGHDRENLVRGQGGPQMAEVLFTVTELTAAANGLEIREAAQLERPTDSGAAIDTVLVAERP